MKKPTRIQVVVALAVLLFGAAFSVRKAVWGRDGEESAAPLSAGQLARISAKARAAQQLEKNQLRFANEQAVFARQILAHLPIVSLTKPVFVKRWDSLPMIFGLSFSPDGSWLAAGGDSRVEVRNARNWTRASQLPGSSCLAWSPDSRLLAVENQGVDVYQVPRMRRLCTLEDGSGMDTAGNKGGPGVYGPLLFSADSSKIVTIGEDPQSTWKLDDGPATDAAYVRGMALKYWDARSGKRLGIKLGSISGGGSQLVRIADNPKDREFAREIYTYHAVSNHRPSVYVFDNSDARRPLFDSQIHPEEPFATIPVRYPLSTGAIAGNGWIYAALNSRYPGNKVDIFRTRDQKLLASLPISQRITAIAISPDAKTLAVAEDHATEKTFADGSTQELSRSRVSIYRLAPLRH